MIVLILLAVLCVAMFGPGSLVALALAYLAMKVGDKASGHDQCEP